MHRFLQFFPILVGISRSAVAKVLDSDIVESEFELQSRFYVDFQI